MSALVSKLVGRARAAARVAPYLGWRRLCPVCGGSFRRFKTFGVVPREDALCPRCGSLERHRLFWLWVTRSTDLLDGRPKRVLHVAPEACFEPRLRRALGDGYLTADLHDPRAVVKIDVTRIGFPDASFDVVVCSHVLEHVPDDRAAMREIRRVLKDGGWAVLNVPTSGATTDEDPGLADPAERLRRFGQEDHVRRYGADYVERLREAGFRVRTIRVEDVAGAGDAARMGLTAESGEIFCCTR